MCTNTAPISSIPSNKEVWDYITGFASFNNYINSPIARYKGEVYNLPFNMNTFNKLWGW